MNEDQLKGRLKQAKPPDRIGLGLRRDIGRFHAGWGEERRRARSRMRSRTGG